MSSVCSNCENIDFNNLTNQYNALKTQYENVQNLLNQFLVTNSPNVGIKGIDAVVLTNSANPQGINVTMTLRSASMTTFNASNPPSNPPTVTPWFFSIQDNTPGYGQNIQYNAGGDGPVDKTFYCSWPSQTWTINGSKSCQGFGGIWGNCTP